MRTPEIRRLDLAAAEIRAEDDEAGRPVIRGVAIHYGSLSSVLRDSKGRPFRERFRPGAFARDLASGADVRFLVNHNPDLILGRGSSQTLKLDDGPDALRFTAYPPNTMIGEHYREAIRRRDLTGVSFRFYKQQDSWDGAGDATVRDIIEAQIDDVSIVTYPAYEDSGAELDYDPAGAVARSLDSYLNPTATLVSIPDRPARDPWRDHVAVRLRLSLSEALSLRRTPK